MIKIQRQTGNGHQFKVQAKSGDTLLTSITFPNKSEMEKAIKGLLVQQITQNDFERQTNTKGKFLFSLRDNKGNAIGHSESYDSEAGMENGIHNLSATLKSLV